MALTDEGGGIFGGDLSIIVLFFLFMMMGGWGNGFGGFGGGDLYPWMNNSQNINDGFRDQMLNNTVMGIQNSITSGFGDIQTALCGGFAGTTAAVTGAQNAITQQMYANTIADMERSYGIQTQLQNCCCENRAAVADLKYTVATEACADRAAVGDALQAVIASNTANTQKILDRLCQQEIDNLKAQNISLQNQVNMLNLTASQTAQTAVLVSDNAAQTQYLINKLTPATA